ncbi:general secretion pathway protein GspB [Candidatus Aerophobetes bacterium]|nr:general secretion pathway protein GspB [Candidatus Aerophobetes bacterium]
MANSAFAGFNGVHPVKFASQLFNRVNMKKTQIEKIAILPLLLIFGLLLWRGYKYIRPQGKPKRSEQIVRESIVKSKKFKDASEEDKKKILAALEGKEIKEIPQKKKKEKKAKIRTKEKFDYPTIEYQPAKRDVFRSPLDIVGAEIPTTAREEAILPQMNLQGWTWGYEPRAIINNQVVQKGDRISGAEVLEIRKEGVILIYQGKVFTIRPKK